MKKSPASHDTPAVVGIVAMTAGLLAAPTLGASSPSLAGDDDNALPRDTAYIDAQPSIDNRADSVTVNGRSFQGPGPYTVYFEAEVPAEATYYAWEIATSANFAELMVQYHDLLVDYTFDEAGTFYARFTTSNADNTSETYGEPYTIVVTESLLEIPNLITPDSPTGHNCVFKVKYKSLRRFEMWVYNRWGNQLFHTTRPDEGWDGTHGGKTVPTGAYYYLVKAEGTDGIKYERKGDINVLRTRRAEHATGDIY